MWSKFLDPWNSLEPIFFGHTQLLTNRIGATSSTTNWVAWYLIFVSDWSWGAAYVYVFPNHQKDVICKWEGLLGKTHPLLSTCQTQPIKHPFNNFNNFNLIEFVYGSPASPGSPISSCRSVAALGARTRAGVHSEARDGAELPFVFAKLALAPEFTGKQSLGRSAGGARASNPELSWLVYSLIKINIDQL